MGGVLSAVLPVFIVAGAAYIIRRCIDLDVRTLATLNIYVFIPSLIFAHLSKSEIEWSVFGQCALGAILMTVCMTTFLSLLAKLRHMDQEDASAFLMTLFPNFGNFGIPVVTFAFGEAYLPLALVILVCGSFMQNSVGVYFAQRSRHSAWTAFGRVFRFPMIYAFVLAMVFQRTQWELPEAAFRAVSITADAAIPVQLMILGAKLAETRLDMGLDVFLAAGTRLLLGPVFAFGVAMLLGLRGMNAKVFILHMSGPTAVAMAVYGVQFGVKPRFLASAVSWSFMLSIVSVSVLLSILYMVDLT